MEDRVLRSEVDAAAVLFPVAVTGGLRAVASAGFDRAGLGGPFRLVTLPDRSRRLILEIGLA